MNCPRCKKELPADGCVFCPWCGQRLDSPPVKRHRGNGCGSAYRRADGRWCAVITTGYKTVNKHSYRKTKTKTGFRTKKAALEYLVKLAEEPEATPDMTMQQLNDRWEPTHKVSQSSINCYRAAWKNFEPLYNRKVSSVTVDDLQACMTGCTKGKRTRENMKALVGLLYKYAIPRKCADLNMGEYLVVGGGEVGEKEGFSTEDLAKIEEAAESSMAAAYVLCHCYLGFRPSEFISLDAKNYDRVEKAFRGGAKTEAGKDRTVTVSPKIQKYVDELVKDKISGPVFCRLDNGQPLKIKDYRNMFYDVLEACKIDNPTITVSGVQRKKYTPHSCRHTFATLMKRVSGSDRDKLELIGHTSTEMLRKYQGVEYEDLRKITDAM